MSMNIQEALRYINSSAWFGGKKDLSRITGLLSRLGDPQKRLKTVHIAGTNGKGSCAAMTASVLKTAGYRTGLFTSPYLYRFHERMRIDGEEIGDEALANCITRVRTAAETMEEHPNAFEMMTATAFLWFAEEQCDITVLETGLGGRLDATNVITDPEAVVIMNIGLDHTKILGNSIAEIAAEKAGIIKPGGDCVLYQQQEEAAREVISAVCREQGAKLHEADFSQITPEFDSLEGQVFSYRGESYALPLLGACQRRNAAVVIELAGVLRRRGWKISSTALEHGLYAVSWPARFEILSDDPYFVLDGGHNPQCAQEVAENLRHYFPGQKHILLAGVLRDKDVQALFSTLDRTADEYICISPGSDRAMSAQDLAEVLMPFGKPVTACETIAEGVELARQRAKKTRGMVCATGSLYMAGEIRFCFGCY